MENIQEDIARIVSVDLNDNLQGNEITDNILDVVGMSDFEEDLSGVSPDMENALLNHILKTRNVIATSPQLIENQQNSTQMLQMYNYLIENWDDIRTRVVAIRILANQEKELVANGFISYDFSDLEMSDTAEHSGFFSVLETLYQEELSELDGLDGFWSKIKKTISKASKGIVKIHKKVYNFHKTGLKKVVKLHKTAFKKIVAIHKKGFKKFVKILPKLNKYNPLTIAVRNAFRGLLIINFLGMASILSQKNTHGVMTKVEKLYIFMGGKKEKLCSAIRKGAKRKPLFNRSLQRKLEKSKTTKLKGFDDDFETQNEYEYQDLEGLGEPYTIGAMLTAAGGFLLKVWNWIKKAGIKISKPIKKIIGKKPFKKIITNIIHKRPKKHGIPEHNKLIPIENTDVHYTNPNVVHNPTSSKITHYKTNDISRYSSSSTDANNNQEGSKGKKVAIIITSVIGITGLIYGAYKLSAKDKKAPKSKLSGITLQ